MKTKNYLDFVVHCFSEMKWTVEWLKRAQDYSSVLFGMAAFPLPLFFGDINHFIILSKSRKSHNNTRKQAFTISFMLKTYVLDFHLLPT